VGLKAKGKQYIKGGFYVTQIIGIDVGYGFVKVTDGQIGYSFPSVVGEGHTKPTFSTKIGPSPAIDNLKIGIGDRLFFVGKSAIKHSRFAYRDLSYTRSISDDLEILFFSALSLFAKDVTNVFNVVTGLPVERMHLAEDFINRVKGERNITLYNGAANRSIKINVSDIEVVPQPLGTYWSSISNSAIAPDGRIGVVDIGFKTTDFATIEDSEYIPEKSKSILVGLATAYDDIGSNLVTEFGVEKESYALDGIVINRKINISGETIDISSIVESAFEKLATNILVEIHSQWNVSEFDCLLLTGGGGQALSSYILPQLSNAKLALDPITANCRGYLTWADRLWNHSYPQNSNLKFD